MGKRIPPPGSVLTQKKKKNVCHVLYMNTYIIYLLICVYSHTFEMLSKIIDYYNKNRWSN